MASEIQGVYVGIDETKDMPILYSDQSSLYNIAFRSFPPNVAEAKEWVPLKVELPDETKNVYVRINELMRVLSIPNDTKMHEILNNAKIDSHYLQTLFSDHYDTDSLVDQLKDKPIVVDTFSGQIFKFSLLEDMRIELNFRTNETKLMAAHAEELIRKFIKNNPNAVNQEINPSALRAVAFMVAEKLQHDSAYKNISYTQIFNIDSKTLYDLELYFLNAIKWDLEPSAGLSAKYK